MFIRMSLSLFLLIFVMENFIHMQNQRKQYNNAPHTHLPACKCTPYLLKKIFM